MKRRGPKPKGRVRLEWSSDFAYAIGLLVTDGCLYNDGRHISLTTKDIEQAQNFKKCLNLKVKIGRKSRNTLGEKKYYHVQFGDVIFYRFLESLGLSKAKSKTIGEVKIPDKYFFDYLRGCFDGDGTFYSYWDTRWPSSHMFYLEFASASKKYISSLQEKLFSELGVRGYLARSNKRVCYQLKYAKRESVVVIKKMYYNPAVVCLSRKYTKIRKVLVVEGKQQKLFLKNRAQVA